MSKFFTPIEVDVASVVRLLPAGAALEGVKWNPVTHQVDVIWDHRPFDTGNDYAIEFSREHLQSGKLPEKVRPRVERTGGPPPGGNAPASARTPATKPVARRRGPAVEMQPE